MSKKGQNTGYSTSISSIGMIERYIHFLEAVQTLKPATRIRIQNYLEEQGDLISESTFHRIRKNLEEGLGIVLEHDKRLGYRIQKESQEELERFMDLTGLAIREGQIKQALLNEPDLFQYVLMEKTLAGERKEILSPILKALLKKKKIELSYHKYGADEAKNYYQLEPHYIKKYLGRWYLFAYAPWLERAMTLAIDNRMTNVQVKHESFTRKEDAFKKLFQVVGLNYAQAEYDFNISEPVGIEFWVQANYVDYIEALPIHPTQTMTKQNSKGKNFRIEVIPNYELVQAFLRMGNQAKILSPSFFVDYFKACVKGVLERYRH
ncbi:MAG: WYL domain-containing protein [Bacteroidetes bacterium]|nr:MAG: WYL domain-containing protein [Bacteroidota bacterium]MBL1144962.1 WYL domain-containing protein [Bacteroidota bacterium]NOG57756.1 WYL domain-containing protein [Bacteroidota bacterium]